MEVGKPESNETREDSKRMQAIDDSVKKFIEKKEFWQVLAFIKLGASKQIIDWSVKKALEEGDSYYAEEIAKVRCEDLREDEVDPAVKKHIEAGNLKKAEDIAELGASVLVRDSIVKEWLAQEEKPYDFLKKAIDLKPSCWVLDYLMKEYCNKGEVKKASLIAKARGQNFTEKEIGPLIAACIKRGHFGSLEDALNLRPSGVLADEEEKSLKEKLIAKGRTELTQEWKIELEKSEIDTMIKNCVKEESLESALKAAKMGASEGIINELVMACCQKGDFKKATEAVNLVERRLTNKEINLLVREKCKEGDIEEAKKIAEYRGKLSHEEGIILLNTGIEKCNLKLMKKSAKAMGRELETAEVDMLIEEFIEKTKSSSSTPNLYWYEVQDAIKLGASSPVISKLIEIYCERGDVEKVLETAKLDNRTPKDGEIEVLVKALAEKGEAYKIRQLFESLGEALTIAQIKIIKDALIKE